MDGMGSLALVQVDANALYHHELYLGGTYSEKVSGVVDRTRG